MTCAGSAGRRRRGRADPPASGRGRGRRTSRGTPPRSRAAQAAGDQQRGDREEHAERRDQRASAAPGAGARGRSGRCRACRRSPGNGLPTSNAKAYTWVAYRTKRDRKRWNGRGGRPMTIAQTQVRIAVTDRDQRPEQEPDEVRESRSAAGRRRAAASGGGRRSTVIETGWAATRPRHLGRLSRARLAHRLGLALETNALGLANG